MSSDAEMQTTQRITRGEIPGRVNDILVNEFSDEQEARVRGYFVSQSLRKIMEFLDPDDIHSLTAKRRVNKSTDTIPLDGEFAEYTTVEASNTVHTQTAYRRDAHHTTFDWQGLEAWLDKQPDVHDLCISELVIRIENEALREHLYTVLNHATGFKDKGEFLPPFFAVMRSQKPGEPAARRAVKEYHEPYYFKPAEQTDGDRRGMNWRVRTLDLMALWSLRAWTDSGNMPLYNLTMHDIEDLAINHVGSQTPEYGAINSKLVINKWRSKFSDGTSDFKRWEWIEQEGWVQVGGGG